MDTIIANKTIMIYSLSLISSSLLIYYLIKRRSPPEYTRVAKVSKLLIYPVKSLSGIEVDSLTINQVCTYGKYKDRQFILIDGENNSVTSQQETSLVKIKLSLNNQNEIWFDAQNFPTLKITIKETVENQNQVKSIIVYDQPIKGIDCGEEASDWFSKYLSKPNIRLLQHVSEMDVRPARTRGYHTLSTEKKFPIIYQNRASIYLLNESSLNDLNERLEPENRVTFRNFRPNIIVTDCPEYEEDNWQYVLINDLRFRFMNHCGRCVKITIDLNTGKMGTEPLKTLRKYRMAGDELKSQFGKTPIFGIYLAPLLNQGFIQINDSVFAQRKSKSSRNS